MAVIIIIIVIIIILMMMIIITNILCTNFKHVKSCKFWICHPKNYLYWILNVEIHLDAMCLEIPLKK